MTQMKSLYLLVIASILSFSALPFTSASSTNASATCPIDLNYVLRLPWNTSSCRDYQSNGTNMTNKKKNPCCQSLLSLFGVGLAQCLKETTLFRLPDLPTSVSCLKDYQTKLSALALPANLVSDCLDPFHYVISRSICASIESLREWKSKLGGSTQLDSSCKPDLTDLTSCDACVGAGFKVLTQLIAVDGNTTHATDCFYYTILYAAGIVNEFGPDSDGALSCIFGLPLISHMKSSNKKHSALVFGLIGAGVAIFVMSAMLGLSRNDEISLVLSRSYV